MLEKFAAWFICFGVSFLAQSCWGTEQGKAFLYIHIGVSVFFVFLPIVLMLISGKGRNLSVPSSIMVLVTAAVIAVSLIVTWGAIQIATPQHKPPIKVVRLYFFCSSLDNF